MRFVLVGLTLVLACATTAGAVEPVTGQMIINVGGGLNVPSNDDADHGYVIGGGLGYHVSSRLVVGAELSYFGYSTERSDVGSTNPLAGTPSQHSIDYLGTAKYFVIAGKTAPYVKGFAGRYDYTLKALVGTPSGQYTYSDLVMGGGVGLMMRGDKESSLYFEALARQLQLEDSRTRLYTFTMGVDFGFLP